MAFILLDSVVDNKPGPEVMINCDKIMVINDQRDQSMRTIHLRGGAFVNVSETLQQIHLAIRKAQRQESANG